MLGNFDVDEEAPLQQAIDMACQVIPAFVLEGVERTMNRFNTRKRKPKASEEKQAMPEDNPTAVPEKGNESTETPASDV